MAGNQIYKYVWLIKTIHKAGKISFFEINQRWLENDISDGIELSKRTFHKWRIAIEEIFDLVIENEKSGHFRYYIENDENLYSNKLSQWLIHSISVSSLIMNYKTIQSNILVEHVPQSEPYLSVVLGAIRSCQTISITYKSFKKSFPFTFEIEPYGVKLFRQRWYVIARNVFYNKIMIYAIDRMLHVESITKSYKIPEDFDLSSFFTDYYGIVSHDGTPFEKVLIKVYGRQVDYFQTLPLHTSQVEIETSSEYSLFEYSIHPTFDFIKELLAYGENIEVISPEWLRTHIAERIQVMANHYK